MVGGGSVVGWVLVWSVFCCFVGPFLFCVLVCPWSVVVVRFLGGPVCPSLSLVGLL